MIAYKRHRQYLPLLIPTLLVIGMFGFVNTKFFSENALLLSKALAFDLLIGIPVLSYFIIKKTDIPLTIMLKIFTICLFISTLIIPETNFELIQVIKNVVYPLLKIWIGVTLVKKAIQVFKEYNLNSKTKIGYTLYSTTIRNVFIGRFGEIILMEFSLIYFLFKAKRKSPFSENEFGYSKNKGTIETVYAFCRYHSH